MAEGQAATRQLEEIQGLLDIPQIADYDGIVASVVDGPGRQLLAHARSSTRAATPGSRSTCPSSSPAARSSGGWSQVSKTAVDRAAPRRPAVRRGGAAAATRPRRSRRGRAGAAVEHAAHAPDARIERDAHQGRARGDAAARRTRCSRRGSRSARCAQRSTSRPRPSSRRSCSRSSTSTASTSSKVLRYSPPPTP